MTAGRIVLVSGSLPPEPCGVGHYTWLLAQGLRRAGRDAVVAWTGPDESLPGAMADECGPPLSSDIPGWCLHNVPAAASALLELEPDIVHFQYPTLGYGRHLGANLLPAALKRHGRPRVAVTFHEPFRWGGRLRNLPEVLAADAIVRVTRANTYPRSLPGSDWLTRGKQSDVIPVPSNIPRSNLSDGVRANLHRELLRGEDLLIGHFGVPRPNKGLEVLPDVLERLPSARLLLVAMPTRENQYWDGIEQRLQEAGMQDRVTITGYLPDRQVADLLATCDAGLYPFRDGLDERHATFLAAVLQGTFTVTTSRSKRGYAVGENVYYASPGDADEMARAILRHAGTRVEPWEGWPTWPGVVRAHERLYDTLLRPHEHAEGGGLPAGWGPERHGDL